MVYGHGYDSSPVDLGVASGAGGGGHVLARQAGGAPVTARHVAGRLAGVHPNEDSHSDHMANRLYVCPAGRGRDSPPCVPLS